MISLKTFNTTSKVKLKKITFLILATISVVGTTGCGSTSTFTTTELPEVVTPTEVSRLDSVCLSQVEELKDLKQGTASQHIMLADLSLSCIKSSHFPARHRDSQKAMQLIALSIVNYIKAGDIQTAQSTLSRFKQTFPQQDLLFADYTSFVDTATALLSHQTMSDSKLALLNINKNLRDELVRQRKWALN